MLTGENQNIEYKQSWRDEYLKWICGFANASGGIMVTIIRNVTPPVAPPVTQLVTPPVTPRLIQIMGAEEY